ncbi:hypothetical protein ACJX0J_025919, partial [Zea mays]
MSFYIMMTFDMQREYNLHGANDADLINGQANLSPMRQHGIFLYTTFSLDGGYVFFLFMHYNKLKIDDVLMLFLYNFILPCALDTLWSKMIYLFQNVFISLKKVPIHFLFPQNCVALVGFNTIIIRYKFISLTAKILYLIVTSIIIETRNITRTKGKSHSNVRTPLMSFLWWKTCIIFAFIKRYYQYNHVALLKMIASITYCANNLGEQEHKRYHNINTFGQE